MDGTRISAVGRRHVNAEDLPGCLRSPVETFYARRCQLRLAQFVERLPHRTATLHVDPAHTGLLAAVLPVLDRPGAGTTTIGVSSSSGIVPSGTTRSIASADQRPAAAVQGPDGAAKGPEQADEASLAAGFGVDLGLFEAVERAKAALDGQALIALARMHATATAMVAAQPEALRTAVPVSPEELVALEVATATGLSQREVAHRLALAVGAPARCARLRQLVATGQVSLYRATQVLHETAGLSDQDQAGVVEMVFAPTRDGAGLSNTLFRSRLRRALLAADADRARRHAAARSRIGAYAQVDRDGIGTLTLVNEAGKIAAAIDRADAAARAARAKGDPRTLAQLRADFLTDAALYGWPTRTAPVTQGEDDRDASPGAAQAGEFARIGTQPPARVRIVIPLSTLLGRDDTPCELPGHGWISAEQARAVAATPESIWQPLIIDPETGRALHLHASGYRPSPAMVEHVRAVDGLCRGPGCQVRADRCDLDHDTPYPIGPTDITNLTAKHRAHHRIKTARFWQAARGESDHLVWTTTAGRRYVTYPHDWLENTRPTPAPGPVTVDHNPEPFTGPYGPRPDPSRPPDASPPPF